MEVDYTRAIGRGAGAGRRHHPAGQYEPGRFAQRRGAGEGSSGAGGIRQCHACNACALSPRPAWITSAQARSRTARRIWTSGWISDTAVRRARTCRRDRRCDCRSGWSCPASSAQSGETDTAWKLVAPPVALCSGTSPVRIWAARLSASRQAAVCLRAVDIAIAGEGELAAGTAGALIDHGADGMAVIAGDSCGETPLRRSPSGRRRLRRGPRNTALPTGSYARPGAGAIAASVAGLCASTTRTTCCGAGRQLCPSTDGWSARRRSRRWPWPE